MVGPPFAVHPTPACAARGSSVNLASMDRNRKLLWADALAYPAQGPALLTLAVLSLLRLLGYVPAWGWLLDLLLWVAMYRYAADVLWQSANGRDDAPEGYNADTQAGWTMLIAQFVPGATLLVYGLVIAWSGAVYFLGAKITNRVKGPSMFGAVTGQATSWLKKTFKRE